MPVPGIQVVGGLFAASISPMNSTDQLRTTTVVAEDDAATVRFFHDQSFFASAGVNFDLSPVSLEDRSRLLLGTAFPGPDIGMAAGQGWIMLRDGRGEAGVFFVDDDTTLESLQAAIEVSKLDVGVAIGQDTTGFRLVLVIDDQSKDAIHQGAQAYGPAESVVSGATVRFGLAVPVGFPLQDLTAANGDMLPMDPAGPNSSWANGELMLSPEGFEGLINANISSSGGWENFDRFATVVSTGSNPILRQEMEFTVDFISAQAYANPRAVRQAEVSWFVEGEGDGGWMQAQGPVTDAFTQFELIPDDYRVFLGPDESGIEIIAP